MYRTYAADSSWNAGHVNDPKLTAMLKEQRHTKDLETRRKIIHDIQRYAAEQQYYVHVLVPMVTASWAPYVKNYGPNITFDYGSRAATLWAGSVKGETFHAHTADIPKQCGSEPSRLAQSGFAAGVTLSSWPLHHPPALCLGG